MPNTQVVEGLYYTRQHEWVRPEGDIFSVGISAYAQDALGDIVYLDISLAENSPVQKEESIGVVESVKAVEDLYAPLAGTIVAVNTSIKEKPELINQDAYKAWIVRIRGADVESLDGLMDARAYTEYIKSLA